MDDKVVAGILFFLNKYIYQRWSKCFGVLLCALVCLALARPSFAYEDLKLVGAGVITAVSPYRGVGTRSLAVPILVWDYKNFYAKGVEAGYYFYKTEGLRASVFTVPRFMGYHSSDSDALQGMKDREMSLDAGVKFQAALPWKGRTLSLKVMNDVLSRNRGSVVELSAAHELKGGIWRLTPSFGVRAQSGRMTDYYYGIKDDEAGVGRPAYKPGAAFNYFADVLFSFGIRKDWIVVTKGSCEFLSNEIRQSPIVKKDILLTGVVGLARKF